MDTFDSIGKYRAWRDGAWGDVGYVASLGGLHDGHRSLLRRTRDENEHVVASVFVNPSQFAPGEDFSKYPHDPEGDAAICAQEGVDVLLVLSNEEVYPPRFSSRVTTAVSAGLFEAAARPDHLNGVATVLVMFFNIVRPNRTYFGLKDYQQVLVVRQLVRDFHVDVEMISMPTVREADGLAMSTRNRYLSAEERQNAPLLYQALREVRNRRNAGERAVESALRRGREIIEKMSVPVTIDYFAAANANTVEPVEDLRGDVVVLAAVRLPSARLIDNLVLGDLPSATGHTGVSRNRS